MLATSLTWAGLFALYLLFAGQASAAEIVAGTLVAGAGVALRTVVHHVERLKLGFDGPWGRLAGRALRSIAHDATRVAWGLLRATAGAPLGGGVVRQRFEPGGSTPQASARRAVVTLAVSVAPNGFVLAVEDQSEGLLLHRLVPQPQAGDPLWPV